MHDDSSIAKEDKMQYLRQSVEPHSKAERLVLSFPATAANYSKPIEQLKERFGRDDLLVQIYVRDLLGLVLKNTEKGRSKKDLTYLYDKLEGKLRNLESLGRTQEKKGQGKEMVQLARNGFGSQHNFRKNNAPVECVIQSELATTSALVSLDSGKRPLCICCDKKNPRVRNALLRRKCP
ncbi:DUF1758 domain-containing protein [Trichonephila clavipes]|nr:DUF1758 domain-containing protein [Trichonephila clavipes]